MSRTSKSTVCFGPSIDSSNDHGRKLTKTTGKQMATKSLRYERQQRYREKQRQYVNRLESTVKRLRMDVDCQLSARHNAQAVHTQIISAPSQLSKMKTADVEAVMSICMQSSVSGVQAEQESFLESAMCSDVHYGDFVGREAILQQWRRFTAYFKGASLIWDHCVVSVDFLGEDVVTGCVRSALVVRLTHSSLATIFPRALTNSRVRDKLLENSTVQLPMSVFFQFDEQGKVCRYEPTIDFVTGLYAVLGNCSEVSSTLESANINIYGQISEELPRAAVRAMVTGDHRDVESGWTRQRNTPHLNKFSVAFLLSSDEDGATRRQSSFGLE